MNEYYVYNLSSYRACYELLELLKTGKLNTREVCERYSIALRTFRKDISCIKEVLYEMFDDDVQLHYFVSKKEFQIVYYKGVANNLFLPYKY